MSAATRARALLFDTDIGLDIDDALALLLCLHLRGVELLGITTVYGCTDLRAKIARKLVAAVEREIPVVSGAGHPISSPMPLWHTGHEGEGALTAEEAAAPVRDLGIEQDAVGFLLRQALARPGEVTLVCLGALTNVAWAIRAEPCFGAVLGALWFMGGGITYPLALPRQFGAGQEYRSKPSHNVRCDVEAARIVLASGAPLHLVPNDVTCALWLEGKAIERFRSARRPEAKLVAAMLDVWLRYRAELFGEPVCGTCPHDPLTLALALGRVAAERVRGHLEIADDGSTVFTVDSAGPCEIVTRIDAKAFLEWLTARLHTDESYGSADDPARVR